MHIKKLNAVAAGLALAAGMVGCSNDKLTNLNTDPNNPTSAPPGPVFTQAVRLAAGRFVGNNFSLRQTEFLTQHWAEVQYPDEDRYIRLDPASTQGTFNGAYTAELVNLKKLADAGLVQKNAAVYGPAQVMSTWDFEYLTDSWGDIPYSQALKADSGINSPTYDAQKDIYASFFKTLTKASTDMAATSGTGYGSADPIYQGNLAKWEKFANSLHARLALRVVNVDQALADAELKAAFSAPGGVFASNADNAKLVWPGDGIYNNPITDNFSGRDDHRVSNTFFKAMNVNNDPRIPVFMQPTIAWQTDSTATKYAGMPNGLTPSVAGTYFRTSSRPGAIFWPGATTSGNIGSAANKKNPSWLMTYAEVMFIKAEAAERGLGGLTAAEAAADYNAAITASMNQWGITDATTIATFLAQPGVVYKGGVAGLKQIAVQKWIALVTDGAQSWAEWRRTCQPAEQAGPDAVNPTVPRRFYYSTTEYSVNAANVAAANARQGKDDFNTPVWWDKTSTSPTCP